MNLPQSYDGPRLLRPEEARASRRLSHACFGQFGGPDPEAEAPQASSTPAPAVEDGLGEGETHVIAFEGVPVSQISIFYTPLRVYESVVGVGSIGGVCTLPEQRQHGLATLLLDHCARQLVEMGSSLMLISGGRGLYRRAGCEPTGLCAVFSARGDGAAPAGDVLEGVDGLRLRPLRAEDALTAARLYQSEPVHFLRPIERFSERLGSGGGLKAAEYWMVERDGRAAAYLLLSNPWEYATRPELGMREVDEYAGSRTALAEAICLGVERGGLREVTFSVPWQDTELIDALQRRLGPPQWKHLDSHTMRILDFPALMTGLHDYMRARLPANLLRGLTFEQSGGLIVSGDVFGQPVHDLGPGRCAISRGAERLELDTAAMTLLILGDPEKRLSVSAPGALQPPGALREIVQALFPLPSFLPGLDYH